jgi:hypothetical protein
MAFSQLVYSSAPTLPQGLKPAYLSALDGTAEAVPYPKPNRNLQIPVMPVYP